MCWKQRGCLGPSNSEVTVRTQWTGFNTVVRCQAHTLALEIGRKVTFLQKLIPLKHFLLGFDMLTRGFFWCWATNAEKEITTEDFLRISYKQNGLWSTCCRTPKSLPVKLLERGLHALEMQFHSRPLSGLSHRVWISEGIFQQIWSTQIIH